MIRVRNYAGMRLGVGDIWEIDADLVVDPPPPAGKDRYEIPGATAVFTSGDFQPFCGGDVKGRRHTHIAYQRLDEQRKARWYLFDLVMGAEKSLHLRDTVSAGQSAVNEHFAWLPDGRSFYLSGNELVLRVNPYQRNVINKGWMLATGYQYRLGTGSRYKDNFLKRDALGGTTEALIHITEDGPQEVWDVKASGIKNGFHAIHVLEGYGYAYSPRDSQQHIVYSCRWDGSDQKNLEGDQQRWSHQCFDGGVMAVNDVTDDGDLIDVISDNGAGERVAVVPMSLLKRYRPRASYIQSNHHQLVGQTLYCSVKDHARSTPAIEVSGVMRIDFTSTWGVEKITTLARDIQHPGTEADGHWEGHVQPAGDPAGVWICYRQDGKLIVRKQESI